jgi:zinc D-Ala-D-Ala carboxypeptidase
MNISEHISYEEATESPTQLRLKIDNTPGEVELNNMKAVANYCFEPLRKWYGKPIKVNSFFRSQALNTAVGGAKNSQHTKGEAIDMSAGSKEENEKLFNWCKANLIYDQLINEYNFSWVHISFRAGNNRKETLIVK